MGASRAGIVLLCLASVAHAQGVIRVATEAECPQARHQCLYTQRVNPVTGAVLSRGSITGTYAGHQTGPQILPLDDTTERLVTISDGAGKYGGIMAYWSMLGGSPITLSSPFLLDLDPAASWNGDSGVGRRMAVLWRQLRKNDDKLNQANEPWALRFVTFDLLRVGSAAPKLVVLSDTPITDWSTLPGYRYGYPYNSRWNTAVEHINGGGWAVGFQSDGDYVVGRLGETGAWIWKTVVAPCGDYAGDVAVRGQRIGYVTTRRTEAGVEVVVGER